MNSLLQEELVAIESIYPDNYEYISQDRINLTFNTCSGPFRLELSFFQDYPTTIPSYYIHYDWDNYQVDIRTKVLEQIETQFVHSFKSGQEIIFTWCEIVISIIEDYLSKTILKPPKSLEIIEPSIVNDQINSCLSDPISPIKFYSSLNPIIEKKSIFIGHCCKVTDMNQLQDALNHILSIKKISTATHNMYAYKFKTENGFVSDHEDDGEDAAGSRLSKLVDLLRVENVLVMVSRWYGGIQLGPTRFKCINNAARQVLFENGFIPTNA